MKCLETKDIAVRRMFEIGDICIINKGIEVAGILTGTYCMDLTTQQPCLCLFMDSDTCIINKAPWIDIGAEIWIAISIIIIYL